MIIHSKFDGYVENVRRAYDSGGGSQPQQTTTTAATVPEYARPYMEDMLGRAQALTSAPAATYGGERIAGFTPLQQQAFGTAQQMEAGPEGFQKDVGSYMSPYIQNVLDVQKASARRESDISGQKQQGQAAQAGAFGGYREGIERSERERALGTQLDTIEKTGLESAYKGATDQYNTGQTQQADLAKLQAGFGGQQQGVQQQFLTQQFQDFQNQQAMPYKQVGFMSDVLHGIPGSQSASNVYQAPPSATSQLAGLGTLAYGLSKAKGGIIDVKEKVKRKKARPAGLAVLALSRMKG